MREENRYWFPAKTYGWGWGLPTAWQGWLVLAVFALLMVAGVFLFPPAADSLMFSVYVGVISVLLVAICWIKGEPPRWRWSK